MNAGRILTEAGVDVEALRRELSPVDPATVNVWPAGRWLRLLWAPGIRGVTQGRLILVHPDLLRGDMRDLARTVVHELVHVRQFREAGYAGFMARYVARYLRSRFGGLPHRQAYLNNPAEVEAREVAARYF